MRQKIFLLTITIGLALHTLAQNEKTDSLKLLLVNCTSDDKRAEYLNVLGTTYRYSNTDSAFTYLLKARALAESIQNPTQMAEAYSELGILWHSTQNKDSAYYYLNLAYQTAKANEDFRGMAKSLNSISIYKSRDKKYEEALECVEEALGYIPLIEDKELHAMLYNSAAIVQKANSNMNQALEFYHQSLRICEERNDPKSISKLCSNIGLLYEGQNQTDLALKYLRRSLKIRIKHGNKLGESYTRTNLGLVYENLGKLDSSLYHYRKSLVIKKALDLRRGEMILYNNMGIIFKKKTLYDSAFYYCRKALDMRIQLKDRLGEARTRTLLGQVYLLDNKPINAHQELDKALALASGYKNYTVLQNIHTSLFEVLSYETDYKNALTHLKIAYAYKDSIFNINKERSIANIEAKYNSLKKEQENLQLIQESELKDARIKRQLLIGMALLLFTVLILILFIHVYHSRNKVAAKNYEIRKQTKKLKKAYKKLKRLSAFKEAMTNMLVHDLKTPLNVITNYKDLKNLDVFDDLMLQAGYSMQNLVYNVLDVYKYSEAKLQLDKTNLSLKKVIDMAMEEVVFLAKGKKLEFVFNCNKNYLLHADEEILRRVFVNLFTNAIKYTSENKSITIKCELIENGYLKIRVINPGKEIPKEKQELIFEYFKQAEQSDSQNLNSNGLGLSFCKLAIEAHQGNIGVVSESNSDVEFWFTLPVLDEESPHTGSILVNG